MPRILAVDDNDINLFILQDILVDEGFEVHVAANGEDALGIWSKQGPIDLLITDIQMPGMDGYALCKQVKSEKSIQNTFKVLGISGENESALSPRLQEAGFDAFLSKPYKSEQLIHLVRQLLET